MSVNQPEFRFYATEDENRITVSFPPGTALTETNADALQRELAALAEGREQLHLIVDLSGITVLTSVILGKFLAVNTRVRAAGGRLSLLNPTPTVHMVFKVTRLDTVLDVRTGTSGMPA